MEPLITISDFHDHADLTENLDEATMKPYILQAQKYELRQLLGDGLFYDLLDDPDATDPPYGDLVDGDDYENSDGDTIKFEGIKPALVHWAYARYLQRSNTTSTQYGLVTKRNDYSDGITDKKEAQLVAFHRNIAETESAYIKAFLNARKDDYPKWSRCKSTTPRAAKWKTIDPL